MDQHTASENEPNDSSLKPKPGHIFCQLCTPSYELLNNNFCPRRLADHIRGVHCYYSPFKCNSCDMTYPSQMLLDGHVKLKHPNDSKANGVCSIRSCTTRELNRGFYSELLFTASVLPPEQASKLLDEVTNFKLKKK